jgi:hypothetical protein
MTGLVSCGDNTNFSEPHALTDVEKAEMERQDSVKNAQLNNVNANLILTYTANITISKTSYDGTSVPIDLDKIAKTFNITKEQLIAGINGDNGALEIKGFAIQGSTHDDLGTATNTGSTWGHWWDKNGDVIAWGAGAMVFAEFNPETESFNVGQYPDHLTDGQTIKFIECLKYNGKRAAVIITVNAKAEPVYVDPETPLAGDPTSVEKTIELTKPYTNDYASVTYDIKDLLRNAFKKTTYQIHQAIDSGELKLYQGEVSTTDPNYTADPPGYWLKADGTAGSWGESQVWCSIGHSKTELYLYGGNHPDNGVAGTTVSTKLIAKYNGGTATFNITFKVTAP